MWARNLVVVVPCLLAAFSLLGCTGEPGDGPISLGACIAGDPAQEVPGCEAGIPPERCGEGFEEDGEKGCVALVPSEPCASGTMATPGDTACREPVSCELGPWGEAPVAASTQYVDANYGGGASDGSESAPWLTVSEGVVNVAAGGVVAIAPGTYTEDIVLTQAVELWGRCPGMVEIVGSAATMSGAIEVSQGASGTEIHSLAVTGDAGGIFVSGATDVLISGVWVHDTAGRGIAVQNDRGDTSATVENTLVERATDFALQALGARVDIENSAFRATAENTSFSTGYGVAIQRSIDEATPSEVTLLGSIVEANHTAGILASGSIVSVESTLVRDTEPSELSSRDGVGVIVQDKDGEPADLTMTSCVVSGTYSRGIAVVGSTAQIEATHVHDVRPQEWDQNTGEAIAIESSADATADVTVRACKLERSHNSGMFIRGSKSIVEGVLIREIKPRASDEAFGRGIAAVSDLDGHRSELVVDACMIDDVFSVGIWVADSDGTITGTQVQNVAVQRFDGLLGDGIAAGTLDPELGQATITVDGSRSETNARSAFMLMGATLTLTQSTSECNDRDVLAFSNYTGIQNEYAFDEAGNNRCGCASSTRPCEAESGN